MERFRVHRRRRVIEVEGLEALIALAEAGRIGDDDLVDLPGVRGSFPAAAIAEIRHLVPTREERLALRGLRLLVGLNLAVAPFLAWAALLDLQRGSAREAFSVLVLFAAVFALPIPFLLRRYRRLREHRRQGFPAPAAAPDPDLATFSGALRRRPLFTQILIGVDVAVFAAALVLGEERVFLAFAKINPAIDAGQWWRLLTPLFLHSGLLHLGFNMMALATAGRLVEGVYGRARFLAVFFLGGLAGSLGSYWRTPSPSVGASGAIFALLGAGLVFGIRHRDALPPAVAAYYRNQIGLWVGVNLLYGFTAPAIDNAAHIGGLLGGALVATALSPRPSIAAIIARRRASAGPPGPA